MHREDTHQKHNPAYPTRGTKPEFQKKLVCKRSKHLNKPKISSNLSVKRTVTETDRQHGKSFPIPHLAVTQTTSHWPFLAKFSPNSIQWLNRIQAKFQCSRCQTFESYKFQQIWSRTRKPKINKATPSTINPWICNKEPPPLNLTLANDENPKGKWRRRVNRDWKSDDHQWQILRRSYV